MQPGFVWYLDDIAREVPGRFELQSRTLKSEWGAPAINFNWCHLPFTSHNLRGPCDVKGSLTWSVASYCDFLSYTLGHDLKAIG